MKLISQIAKETGCTYEEVYRAAKNNGQLINDNQYRHKLNKMQENFVLKILYFERKCDVVIFESKMNRVESKEELFEKFREFKKMTYGTQIPV